MTEAKSGDNVKVHYTGKLDDGTVFDTSVERDPLEFTVGEGKLIPDFEKAVVGMNPGETKTIQIPSENAYGPHREEMMMVVDRSQFPKELEPEVGQHPAEVGLDALRLEVSHRPQCGLDAFV